jgi:citrate/tricarballylate utilization protein
MPFDDLFAEAERQLSVCNSCRYCAGYCSVWPALELRSELTPVDAMHLANLCHDCQDCFTACMYTAPHAFDINPPALFAELREQVYHDYRWPGTAPAWLRAWTGKAILFVTVALLLVALSYLDTGGAAFGASSGSAYALLGHWLMVGIVLAPFAYSFVSLLWSARRYWADVHGPLRALLRPRIWQVTLWQAARLTHQSGGGLTCTYPDDAPSGSRRYFHHLVAYGFGLTIVSTIAAAIYEYFFDILPPYRLASAPVISGTIGGLMMIAGCAGLLVLKSRSPEARTPPATRAADYGFIWALLVLSVSGLLVLAFRSTEAFGPLLVIHLATVIICFSLAPYTKFVHWIYRLLAIYKDNLEQTADSSGYGDSLQ